MKMEILTVQNQYDVTKGQYDMFVILLKLFTLAKNYLCTLPYRMTTNFFLESSCRHLQSLHTLNCGLSNFATFPIKSLGKWKTCKSSRKKEKKIPFLYLSLLCCFLSDPFLSASFLCNFVIRDSNFQRNWGNLMQ